MSQAGASECCTLVYRFAQGDPLLLGYRRTLLGLQTHLVQLDQS